MLAVLHLGQINNIYFFKMMNSYLFIYWGNIYCNHYSKQTMADYQSLSFHFLDSSEELFWSLVVDPPVSFSDCVDQMGQSDLSFGSKWASLVSGTIQEVAGLNVSDGSRGFSPRSSSVFVGAVCSTVITVTVFQCRVQLIESSCPFFFYHFYPLFSAPILFLFSFFTSPSLPPITSNFLFLVLLSPQI